MKIFKHLILFLLFGVLISCMNDSDEDEILSNQTIFKFGERMKKNTILL